MLDHPAQCWDDTHPDLRRAEDAAWQGMIDYFLNDGFEADAWGPKEGSAWSEQNATAQDLYGVVICEPCNYASNVAYFHDATEMCRSR